MLASITASSEMLSNLVACVRPDVLPLPLCCNAASCLLVVSEDNADFAQWLAGVPDARAHMLAIVAADAQQPFAAELALSIAGVCVCVYVCVCACLCVHSCAERKMGRTHPPTHARDLLVRFPGVLANCGMTEDSAVTNAIAACAARALDTDVAAALTAFVPRLPKARQAEQENFAAEEEVRAQRRERLRLQSVCSCVLCYDW